MYGNDNQNYNQNLYGQENQQAYNPYAGNGNYGANSGYQGQSDPAQQYGQQPSGGNPWDQPQQMPAYGQAPQQPPPQVYTNQQVKPVQNFSKIAAPAPSYQAALEDAEVSDRMKFVRKVYSILACQLTLTTAFIAFVQYSDPAKKFIMAHQGLTIVALVGYIVFACMILCCFGRKHPTNLILLAAFTVCLTYLVGGITIYYSPEVVVQAGIATSLVTVSLTIYAFKTKVDIEVFYAMAYVVYFAMLPILIISLFCFPGNILYTLYNVLGVLLYSLFLIIDTMMICKNGKGMSSKQSIGYDDYVIGALMLYLDIVGLFLYILQLFGGSNNN